MFLNNEDFSIYDLAKEYVSEKDYRKYKQSRGTEKALTKAEKNINYRR